MAGILFAWSVLEAQANLCRTVAELFTDYSPTAS
jgi:hypothetical protein